MLKCLYYICRMKRTGCHCLVLNSLWSGSHEVVRQVDIRRGEVRGHVLDIDDLHFSITFTSTSDTLFTSLFLKHKKDALMTVFDGVLALFRHLDFRLDRVTLRETEDVYVHVAHQRQIIAQNRRSRKRNINQAPFSAPCPNADSCWNSSQNFWIPIDSPSTSIISQDSLLLWSAAEL